MDYPCTMVLPQGLQGLLLGLLRGLLLGLLL